MAGRYEITLDRGTTLTRTFTVTDSNDVPVDYTGYSAKMQVRKDHAATTVIVEASTSNGRMTVNSQGVITLAIPDDVSASFPVGTAYYDILLTDPGGDTHKLLEGRFIVQPSVTRLS
jgi:hypothetical protein